MSGSTLHDLSTAYGHADEDAPTRVWHRATFFGTPIPPYSADEVIPVIASARSIPPPVAFDPTVKARKL